MNKSDAYILHNPKNIYYFTGFYGSAGVAVIMEDRKLLFTDGRYDEYARSVTDFEVVKTNTPYEEIAKLEIKNAFIENSYLTLSRFSELKKELADCVFSNVDEYIKLKRAIKSEKELENIKMAANIANVAYKSLEKANKTEKGLALELDFAMRKLGASDASFDTIIASGKNASKPHAVPSSDFIQNNAYTVCDFGAIYNHYHSDMTRSFVLGEPSDQLKEIYDIVLEAKNLGLKAVKAGVKASDIDKTCRNFITLNGYNENFSHSTGHGVGLDIHEYPTISNKNDAVLEENMVITVEPGIYIPNVGGVRIEDMVQVTKDGYINFSLQE